MMKEPEDYLRGSIIDLDRRFHASVAVVWKTAITVLTLIVFLGEYGAGVNDGSPIWNRVAYIFSHANIFHLAGNLLCLWRIKPRMHMPEALLIAVAVTWLPLMTGDNVTMGLSGVLFAICGIKWGQMHRFLGMLKYCGVIVAVTALIPNMSWAIHVYALAAGFAYGWLSGLRHRDLRR